MKKAVIDDWRGALLNLEQGEWQIRGCPRRPCHEHRLRVCLASKPRLPLFRSGPEAKGQQLTQGVPAVAWGQVGLQSRHLVAAVLSPKAGPAQTSRTSPKLSVGMTKPPTGPRTELSRPRPRSAASAAGVRKAGKAASVAADPQSSPGLTPIKMPMSAAVTEPRCLHRVQFEIKLCVKRTTVQI